MIYCKWVGCENVSDKINTPSDESYLVGVEGERVRRPLWAAPERLASARDGILGETVQQLADRVVIFLLELQARPDDALLEREGLVRDKVRQNLLDLFLLLARVLEVVLQEVGVRQVRVYSLGRLYEQAFEILPCPLRLVLAP